MKIRTDLVTNSSSVSFIVSWSPDFSEFIRLKNQPYGEAKKRRIYQALTRDLKENGQRLMVGENEVYVKKYGFMKKTECLYDATLDQGPEGTDFEAMDEDKLWAYIWGEYLVNARLAQEFKGFGTVQVPRDIQAFQDKFCAKITCDQCPRKETAECFKRTHG